MGFLRRSSSHHSTGEQPRPPRWYRVLKWIVFYLLCGVLCIRIGQAMALYEEVKVRAEMTEQTLERLQQRKREAEVALRGLEMKKGLDKAFVEQGFIRPGERVLLFPPEEPEKPHPPAPSVQTSRYDRTSAWVQRIGRTTARAVDALKRLFAR